MIRLFAHLNWVFAFDFHCFSVPVFPWFVQFGLIKISLNSVISIIAQQFIHVLKVFGDMYAEHRFELRFLFVASPTKLVHLFRFWLDLALNCHNFSALSVNIKNIRTLFSAFFITNPTGAIFLDLVLIVFQSILKLDFLFDLYLYIHYHLIDFVFWDLLRFATAVAPTGLCGHTFELVFDFDLDLLF